jgi:hypothetical protein
MPFRRLTAALAGRYLVERQIGAGGMATVYLFIRSVDARGPPQLVVVLNWFDPRNRGR